MPALEDRGGLSAERAVALQSVFYKKDAPLDDNDDIKHDKLEPRERPRGDK